MTEKTSETYQRALNGALLGLGLQTSLALLLLALALWPGSSIQALWPTAAFAGIGLLPWIALGLLFLQHKLERLEALETQELQQRPAPEGTLFERSAADLALARRRLNQFHRWLLPGTGLLSGSLLLALAFLFLRRFLEAPAGPAQLPGETIAALALTGGATFAGFAGSRYLTGLAKHPQWQLLQGGAAYLMGTVTLTGLLTLGYALAHFESALLLNALALAVPALEALLGLEMLLNLLLNLYRPRRRGEHPRPAFDSRLLGLLTASAELGKTLQEALFYQFGFEVTRSWFWRLLSRAALPLAGCGLLALLLASCLVLVEPHQQAAVLRLGRLHGQLLPPGLHLKLPFPLESVQILDVASIREIRVGSTGHAEPGAHDEEDGGGREPILWGTPHDDHHGGHLLVASDAQAGPATGPAAAAPAGPSVSVLFAEIPVQYRIRNALDYLRNSGAGDRMLACLAETESARFLLGRDIDTVLGSERGRIGELLRKKIQQAADDARLGLEIVFVGMAGVHPDKEVASSFYETVLARQEKEIRIEEARKNALETLAGVAGRVELAEQIIREIGALETLQGGGDAEALKTREARIDRLLRQAGGKASELIAAAHAERWQLETRELGRAARFEQERLAQEAAPELYRNRRYLEVLRLGLDEARKYLLLGDREKVEFRLDLKTLDDALRQIDLMGKN